MPFIYEPRKSRRSFTSGPSAPSGGGSAPSGPRYGFGGVTDTSPSGAPAYTPSRERGAPERIQADVMGLVQTAAQAPAHTLERPLAVANTAAKFIMGTPQEEKGPLDQLLEGIGKIGIGDANIGNALGAVGEGIVAVGNVPMAFANAGDADVLARVGHESDNTLLRDAIIRSLPGGVTTNTALLQAMARNTGGPAILGMLGIGGKPMTVGEFKAELARRGFNQQVNHETGEAVELPWEQVIAKAQTDSLSFGDKAINDSIYVDLAARIAGDPFNLLLGAGVAGKAAGLLGWATRSRLGEASIAAGSKLRSAFGVGYLADMSQAGIRLAQKPSAALAARAINAGRMEGATLRGLGMALAAPRNLLLPGAGSIGQRYARGALRTELGLLGVEAGTSLVDNAATSVLGEDNVISGFMEPIHDASQAFLADKPMSSDITFMLVSAFAMPAIPLIKEDVGALRSRGRETFGDQDLYLWGKQYGVDESGIRGRQDPLGRRRGKAREQQLLTRLGGQPEFARLIDHIDMRIAFERMKAYSPVVAHFASFDEAMARSRAIGHVVAMEARRMREGGQIKPQDRLAAFEGWGRAHSRTILDKKGNLIKDMPQRVDFELSPEALIDQWIRYRDVHAGIASRIQPVGEAILGRANRLTKEDLGVVRATFASAAKGGRIDSRHVRDTLIQTPAMFEDTLLSEAQREYWTRLMNLGVSAAENGQGNRGTLDLAELDAHLQTLEGLAPTARELYHEAAASERKAPASPSGTAGAVRAGKLRRIYSTKKLRDLRVNAQGEVRHLTKEIDRATAAMEQKWTSRGNLRLRRAKPVRQTKPGKAPNTPVVELQGLARTYNETRGMPALRQGEYWELDSDFARRTGLAYEAMDAVGTDRATEIAYERFAAETLEQYEMLTEAGYVMEPWTKDGQPYQSSAEMQADVRNNKHLYFFTGGEKHPFLGEPLARYGGLTTNDIFRAVHDIITHATEGYQFGARGEVNAAIKHSQMFTPIARRAMLSETHGQNSWVNYGPHNPQKLAAPDRPYAVQKSALLPDEIIHEFESRYLGETHAVASRKARDAAEALGLTGEQANAAAAILEARARAWASNNPGKTAADYLRRFEFESGGEPGLEALFQKYNQGLFNYRPRTAGTAFPKPPPLREGSKLSNRLARAAAKAAKRRDGILPAPGTAAGRAMARKILPDTPEVAWLKEVALGEVLGPDGAGPYFKELDEFEDTFYRAVYREQQRQLRATGELSDDVLFQVDTRADTEGAAQAPIEAVSDGGRDRTTLEPLLNEPPPQALVDAGMADAAPIEWVELANGEEMGLPGGAEGELSLWDAWRLKAQHVDPNLIPAPERVDLYDKLLRSQVRPLDNVVDNFNRVALSLLSPNTKLLDNEVIFASIRARSSDDLARLAEMTPEEFDAQMGATKASPGFPSNHRAVQEAARRMAAHPDWYVLREGETTVQFAERMISSLPGAGLKVGNFLAMLGDPHGHPIGTIDKRIVERLTVGDLKGFLPERLQNTKASSFRVPEIPLKLKDGSINPAVPEHLRDIPEDLLPANGKVSVFGGDYMIFNDALERAVAAKYGELPFRNGGAQWMEWDLERHVIEPHTSIFPGSDLLPAMAPEDIGAARNVAREAGYFRQPGRREPYSAAEGVFYQEGETIKGSTEFLDDSKVVIRGLAAPDISTFVHEVGHVFRRDLVDEDLAVAEAHYKVVDGVWTREAEEAFAGDFERWTRVGKGAPAGLDQIFAKLYEWMRQVYRTVLRRDVDPEVGQVFTNLFKEKEILRLNTRGFQPVAPPRTGTPGVSVVRDELVGETRIVTLAKYADDGSLASRLEIRFDPDTGTAAPDGLSVQTELWARGNRHASDLYDYAEAQGWEVEQASARSESTLTPEGRAFQKARWAKQRAGEQASLETMRNEVKTLKTEVREINARADELRTTRIDPSFLDENGNPTVEPESLERLREQTAYVNENFPRDYGIEKAPKVSYARYEPDDSHLAALLTERSNLAQVLFDYGPLAKMTQFIQSITAPIKSSKMAHDGRQQVFNLLLPLNAKTKEVSQFLELLRSEQEKGYSIGPMNNPFFRGITALPPNRISTIAREAFGSNERFVKAFTEKYGGMDRTHVMLDEAHNSLIRRIDLRAMRGQKNGKLERIFRSGYWAWQHLPGLRLLSDSTRMVSKVYYPLFRFSMDVRWLALNEIEADTLAFFRDGVDGTRFSGRADQVVRRGGRDVNLTQNAVDYHGAQSGMPQIGKKGVGSEAAYEDTGIFLTNKRLAPVLKRSFQKQSLENVEKTLNDMAEHDPILQLLRRKYGEEQGTWADQLNETLYSFDRRGVRQTIDETVRKVRKYEKWSQAEYDQMVPFINKLIERNQQTFNDLTQIHVGNINRSQLERTLNSFWLYWPLSYQIKATKWMVGLLTQRSFGQQTNLGGAFTLDRAAQRVREMTQNPEFAQQMEDNEDWWFMASMLLPIAPWDYGMSLNRHVRYVGGNVLGLWPEYAGLDGPDDYLAKTLEMGPVYTVEMLQRLFPAESEGSSGPTPTSLAP